MLEDRRHDPAADKRHHLLVGSARRSQVRRPRALQLLHDKVHEQLGLRGHLPRLRTVLVESGCDAEDASVKDGAERRLEKRVPGGPPVGPALVSLGGLEQLAHTCPHGRKVAVVHEQPGRVCLSLGLHGAQQHGVQALVQHALHHAVMVLAQLAVELLLVQLAEDRVRRRAGAHDVVRHVRRRRRLDRLVGDELHDRLHERRPLRQLHVPARRGCLLLEVRGEEARQDGAVVGRDLRLVDGLGVGGDAAEAADAGAAAERARFVGGLVGEQLFVCGGAVGVGVRAAVCRAADVAARCVDQVVDAAQVLRQDDDARVLRDARLRDAEAQMLVAQEDTQQRRQTREHDDLAEGSVAAAVRRSHLRHLRVLHPKAVGVRSGVSNGARDRSTEAEQSNETVGIGPFGLCCKDSCGADHFSARFTRGPQRLDDVQRRRSVFNLHGHVVRDGNGCAAELGHKRPLQVLGCVDGHRRAAFDRSNAANHVLRVVRPDSDEGCVDVLLVRQVADRAESRLVVLRGPEVLVGDDEDAALRGAACRARGVELIQRRLDDDLNKVGAVNEGRRVRVPLLVHALVQHVAHQTGGDVDGVAQPRAAHSLLPLEHGHDAVLQHTLHLHELLHHLRLRVEAHDAEPVARLQRLHDAARPHDCALHSTELCLCCAVRTHGRVHAARHIYHEHEVEPRAFRVCVRPQCGGDVVVSVVCVEGIFDAAAHDVRRQQAVRLRLHFVRVLAVEDVVCQHVGRRQVAVGPELLGVRPRIALCGAHLQRLPMKYRYCSFY
eukprot:Rhum_TRINITY_DN18720_c0_g1::Rhum_TRINITY_DN18720_c0_g1_i1::g.168241::m.168241